MDEVARKLWSGAAVSGRQVWICNVLPVVEEKQMISIGFETQEPYWNLPCSYTFLQDNTAKVRDVRTSLLAVSSSIWLTSCCHSLFTKHLMVKSATYLIIRKMELHKYRLSWLFIKRHETVYWFPMTPATNDHKCGGLKTHTWILLQFWRSEAQNQFPWAKIKVSAGLCSLGAPSEWLYLEPFWVIQDNLLISRALI